MGEKDDGGVLVQLADALCGRHAVHPGQPDFQKNDVVNRAVMLQKLLSLPENGDPGGNAPLVLVLGEKLLEPFQSGRITVHSRDAKQMDRPPFFCVK